MNRHYATEYSEDISDGPEELPVQLRISLAIQAYYHSLKSISIRKLAARYGLPRTTLQNRINGMVPHAEAHSKSQRLTPTEEEAIKTWILQLARWGWPIRINQLCGMALEVLRNRDDHNPLGINWAQKYLSRHPDLASKFLGPMEKDRVAAADPERLAEWFELYKTMKKTYNIKDEDTYNMDEKGFMLGVLKKMRVIIPKYMLRDKGHITHCGNREWVSLLECISMDGRLLRPWIIFKGKQQQKVNWEALSSHQVQGHIAMSENGWTDNELGLLWIRECFEPFTRRDGLNDGFRMLIFDGHQSHITNEAIQFCEAYRIIPLCLPAHTTHLLQPLDVSFFGPLAAAYRKKLRDVTMFGANYSVDKRDFLECYISARRETGTPTTIQNAWKYAGLNPLDPSLIISALPAKRPITPPQARAFENGVKTPANTQQVNELIQLIKDIDLQVDPKVEKLANAAIHAFTYAKTQENVNENLMKINQRKQQRKDKRKGNWGRARVMSSEVVKEREAILRQQENEQALKVQQREEAKQQKKLDKAQQLVNKQQAKVQKAKASQRARNQRTSEEMAMKAIGDIHRLFDLPKPPPTPRKPPQTPKPPPLLIQNTPRSSDISPPSPTRPRSRRPAVTFDLPSPGPTMVTRRGRPTKKPSRLLE